MNIGCYECAWGKVAGCWRCGSRARGIEPEGRESAGPRAKPDEPGPKDAPTKNLATMAATKEPKT